MFGEQPQCLKHLFNNCVKIKYFTLPNKNEIKGKKIEILNYACLIRIEKKKLI